MIKTGEKREFQQFPVKKSSSKKQDSCKSKSKQGVYLKELLEISLLYISYKWKSIYCYRFRSNDYNLINFIKSFKTRLKFSEYKNYFLSTRPYFATYFAKLISRLNN